FSGLYPRQVTGLPPGRASAMAARIGRAFKAAGDIETFAEALGRRAGGRSCAANARPAQEIERGIRGDVARGEFRLEPVEKIARHLHMRPALPLDQDRLLADGAKVGHAD